MADGMYSMSDADFLAMAQALSGTIASSPTTYGLTLPFSTQLDGEVANFQQELTAHVDKQAQAKAQTILKNDQRATLEALVRDARMLAKAAKIPEATYTQMGIPSNSDPAPSAATVPAGRVDTSERFRHTLSWTDAATPETKKKPVGAMGVEIWVKIDGPLPADEKDAGFVTLDASTPYVATYSGAEVGKTAHYLFRWRMRDGSVGAWGETVSATITG